MNNMGYEDHERVLIENQLDRLAFEISNRYGQPSVLNEELNEDVTITEQYVFDRKTSFFHLSYQNDTNNWEYLDLGPPRGVLEVSRQDEFHYVLARHADGRRTLGVSWTIEDSKFLYESMTRFYENLIQRRR